MKGTHRVKGLDTFHFIYKKDVPRGKNTTYTQFYYDIWLKKDEVNRTWMTTEWDRVDYDGKISTEITELKTIKIHLNSTISTEGTKYAAIDIGNFYTNSKLDSPEFMRIHLSLIPCKIIDEYYAMKFVDANGYVYIMTIETMYSLAQSGWIANLALLKRLAKYRYYSTKRTLDLW